MKKMAKMIIGISIIFLLIGTVSAIEFKDTSDATEDLNEITIHGKKVATIEEFDSSDCIQEKILSKDAGAIIKHITENGADEVTSVDNPDDVYEFLTNEGFYYTFGKDGKTYIVTINEDEWDGTMLKEMDEWCLENSK